MAFKDDSRLIAYMTYILMLASMTLTLTLIQGHSGSAEENITALNYFDS